MVVSRIRIWSVFITGLALCGLGVAFSTQAGLGTSPISSVPYILTFLLPLSFGTWTLITNVFFVLGQHLIMREKFDKFQYCQLPATVVFGVFIDIGMALSGFFRTEIYCLQLLLLLAGCILLGLGIAMQLFSNVLVLPVDGFVRAVAWYWKRPFFGLKICFDISLVLLALLISVGAFREVVGLREGTVVAALLVGTFVRFFMKLLRPLKWYCLVPHP